MENKEININNYRVVFLLDCDNIILLNKKHTIEEFQEEINRAKEKAKEDIRKYGDDWNYIQMNMSKDFDYIELYSERENNTIIF